ncbi:LPXTG cell wall anchor domain-containing protein [Actinoplanes friuliensis]|uniref:LPXTG cell wall anchor domain-containing protein n=1 Tax=Actinoplanes friuliensis TaxID=196914 RepID=UPI00130DF880|nr:LPXTG cell wall anchor domain-containing protein [Actinoplanes friuliensis]
MSLTRRLAAGIPAAGVTVLAALALSGSPAAATGDESAARAKQPAVMATPCSEVPRGEKCDYAYGDDDEAPGDTATDDVTDTPTRGGPGYGGESPTPSPSVTPTTPTASVDTVPPGGESPAVTPSASTPGGVSAGGTLPLTGAPMGITMGIGGLMVAAGAAAILITRRRRSA